MRAPFAGADPVHVDDAIKTRRSHKLFNGTPVAATTVRDLLELAIWAPNHKRTEPWRFAVARGPKLAELADASAAMLAPLGDKARGKIEKTRCRRCARPRTRSAIARITPPSPAPSNT
jgi:nitroreductase